MKATRPRWRSAPSIGPAAVLARTVLAGIAGALFSDAHTAAGAGDDLTAMVLWTVAALTAGWVALGAVLEYGLRRAEHRRAIAAVATAVELRRANRALRSSARYWRARALYLKAQAVHLQAVADRAEAEVHTAMLHTPMGQTLAEVYQLPDTRRRSS